MSAKPKTNRRKKLKPLDPKHRMSDGIELNLTPEQFYDGKWGNEINRLCQVMLRQATS